MKVINLEQISYQHKSYLDGSEANIYISSDNTKLLKKFNKNILVDSLEKNKIITT